MAYTHFARLPKFHISQKKPHARAARNDATKVRQSPAGMAERAWGSPRSAASETRIAGGATQTSGKTASGTIPTARSPAQERRSAAAATARGRAGESGRHSRNAPSTRGKVSRSSRVDSTAGSTVAKGRVAKRKYSIAPNSAPPT